MDKPRITIITTGGTIAAAGKNATTTSNYDLKQGLNPVVDYLPAAAGVADLRIEAFSNIASFDLTIGQLCDLARRIDEVFQNDEADGVVITHGTNTIEETAYFLDLVVQSERPVVITGAMRPSSALSADGPLNLYHAVCVAANEDAKERGVLVVLNDRIATARDVTKAHTSAPDAFRASDQGYLGAITGEGVAFFGTRQRASLQRFAVGTESSLPRVDIVATYLGMDARLIDAAVQSSPAGIVVAATGGGGIPQVIRPSLLRAHEAGIAVVRASRVGSGSVVPLPIDDELCTIAAGPLSPQKAHILLMFALRETRDLNEIRSVFRG